MTQGILPIMLQWGKGVLTSSSDSHEMLREKEKLNWPKMFFKVTKRGTRGDEGGESRLPKPEKSSLTMEPDV